MSRARLCLVLAAVILTVGGGATAKEAAAAPAKAVQAHLMWSQYDSAAVDRQMDRAKAAGAEMLRVDVGWASLEKAGKGQYDAWYLNKLDHVVDGAGQRGLRLLLTFWETPCWASAAPSSLRGDCTGAWWSRGVQRYPPVNPSDYADAFEWVVRRYGGRVAAWEIWNEPNHQTYFKADDQAGSYAALVKAAYPAAKRGSSAPTVIAGSLADADYQFTERLLQLGVGGHFDAWSVHPYSEDRSPLHAGISGWEKKSMVSGVPRVRDTLLRHGHNTPLWLTEFGWSTCTVRNAAAWENCVDERGQAEYLKEAYETMRRWDYVPAGVWFNLQDTSGASNSRLDNYGLLRLDGSEKPAYAAFRSAPPSGAPWALAASAPKKPARPAAGRIKLRVVKGRRKVLVRGLARGSRAVVIRVLRIGRRSGRPVGVASYRRVIKVKRSGRFRARLPRRFSRGRWYVQATARGAKLRPAHARLR